MFFPPGSSAFDRALLVMLLPNEKQKICDWLERPISSCSACQSGRRKLLLCGFIDRTVKGVPAWLFAVPGIGFSTSCKRPLPSSPLFSHHCSLCSQKAGTTSSFHRSPCQVQQRRISFIQQTFWVPSMY